MQDLNTESISDASLLESYASRRDEAAFGELVKRHGPLVLRVCRRSLMSEHDVEDVFQATFSVLAHKATAICWTESVERWLCGVARRLVLHARARQWRRLRQERLVTNLGKAWDDVNRGALPESYHPAYDPHEEIERGDIRRVLHAALGQLPDKYREPVVLCYLEGLTNEEAARHLGWPPGTMSRRLQRARSLLRQRLARCGLMIALVVSAAFAITRVSRVDPGSQDATVSVRQAMQSLRLSEGAETKLEASVQQLLGSNSVSQEREPLVTLARKAQWVAEQVADQNPSGNSDLWLFHAARMRLAAIDLGHAARTGDQAALLGAVRNMDLTCIGCHNAFRH
jgi:RNA polymerase sigma-70 factor (ECF subfamily)